MNLSTCQWDNYKRFDLNATTMGMSQQGEDVKDVSPINIERINQMLEIRTY